MQASEFFQHPQTVAHKQYEALRAFYLEGKSAAEVAQQFGYTISAFYSLTRDFNQRLKQPNPSQRFFLTTTLGRKPQESKVENDQLILSLRKKDLSVSEIKAILDSLGHEVSERYIYNVIAQTGMKRLPRRTKQSREQAMASVKLPAPPSKKLTYRSETFRTPYSAGVLCLLPYIQTYGIHRLIESSDYPESQNLNRLSSILSFVGLKLSNIKRYTTDDLWCMDRGLGLFAGLTVLPKASWFSSYSHRVTRAMNLSFLKSLHRLWQEHQLLGDSANIDFVIKVDFDLTMSILAHNLYRLLAMDLPGFEVSTSTSLFNKFICNSAQVQIDSQTITVLMKKKRNLPPLLNALEPFQNLPLSWMQNQKFRLLADSTS